MLKNSSSKILVLSFILIIMLSGIVGAQNDVEKISIKEAIEFKSFDSYSESPFIQEENFVRVPYLVEKELEPVEQRLPETPKVITEKAMPDGVGEYGGMWRDFSAWPPKSYNWFSGLTTGAFGLDDMYFEPVLSDYMATFVEEGMEPEPNLAQSWEWSNDKKTLTLNLVKGIRWSDGVEFTADDIIFTYEDLYLDPKIPLAGSVWEIGGELPEMEKVDDYTLKIHIAKPSNQIFYNLMKMFPMPKHIYVDYHPKYSESPNADYESFKNAFRVPSVPVVLGPYIPYRYKTGEAAELIRNPYHFKVDAEGKQLPYIDKIRYTFGQETRQSTMQLMAGNIDWANMDDPSQFPTWMQNREKGNYRVIIPEPHQLYTLRLNYMMWEDSMQQPERDKAVRTIFRNKKFRQAFSHSINRSRIKKLFAPDPVVESVEVGGISPASAFYQPEKQVAYSYDPEKAKALFDEIGLKDTNGDGIREFPEGSALAGENFTISILASSDANDIKNIAELVAKDLNDIGLNVEMRVRNASLIGNRVDAGTYDITVDRGVPGTVPLANLESFGPIFSSSPAWHMASPDGERDLMDFESDLVDLLFELQAAVTFEEQKKLMGEIHQIYTENVYSVGVVARRKAHAVANRFRNIHPTAAKKLWDDRQYTLPWTVWVPKDMQLDY